MHKMGFETSNLAYIVRGNVSDKLFKNNSNYIFVIPAGNI